jgi:uncharacterized protein
MKEYTLDLEILERVGVELMAVPVGEVIEVDLRLESVTEGILATGQIYAVAKGECTRCLDPIEIELNRTMQELFRFDFDMGFDDEGRSLGRLKSTGLRPHFEEKLAAGGIKLDDAAFSFESFEGR